MKRSRALRASTGGEEGQCRRRGKNSLREPGGSKVTTSQSEQLHGVGVEGKREKFELYWPV